MVKQVRLEELMKLLGPTRRDLRIDNLQCVLRCLEIYNTFEEDWILAKGGNPNNSNTTSKSNTC